MIVKLSALQKDSEQNSEGQNPVGRGATAVNEAVIWVHVSVTQAVKVFHINTAWSSSSDRQAALSDKRTETWPTEFFWGRERRLFFETILVYNCLWLFNGGETDSESSRNREKHNSKSKNRLTSAPTHHVLGLEPHPVRAIILRTIVWTGIIIIQVAIQSVLNPQEIIPVIIIPRDDHSQTSIHYYTSSCPSQRRASTLQGVVKGKDMADRW